MVTPKGSMSTEGEFLPHTLRVCGRNLITGLTPAASPRVDISSTCKVGQKIWVSLPLLTGSPSAWPFRLLYRRGRKSWRELWITLYIMKIRDYGGYLWIRCNQRLATHCSFPSAAAASVSVTGSPDNWSVNLHERGGAVLIWHLN